VYSYEESLPRRSQDQDSSALRLRSRHHRQLTDPLPSHHITPLHMLSSPPAVHGLAVTSQTQCAHWHSPLDIIAIKHFCCNRFYACISCHDECEDHRSGVWPRDQRYEYAVLCGSCKHILTVNEYMKCGSKCSACGSAFNPGCKNHWGLYFELDSAE
jgi:uncharacterized CHY-type Zn-finger protein